MPQDLGLLEPTTESKPHKKNPTAERKGMAHTLLRIPCGTHSNTQKETRPPQAATQQDAVSTQQIKARPLQQLPHGSHRTQAHSIQGVATAEEAAHILHKSGPQLKRVIELFHKKAAPKSQVCHS